MGVMRRFKLIRIASLAGGSFGVLLDNIVPFCVTLERPWLNNERNISCIPTGEYHCKRINSSRFGNTFQVESVPDRSHILFHKGNLAEDSHGCIIVGEEFGILEKQNAVLSSGRAMSEFLNRTHFIEEFILKVKNVAT